MLTLYTKRQESLKASTTQQPIGKKRKEATQQEIRAYTKQFLEAKQLERKSWLANKVFDLVDTRKLQVTKPEDGVLTIKSDKEGNFLKTKARWADGGSSQCAHVSFLAQDRNVHKDSPNSRTPR